VQSQGNYDIFAGFFSFSLTRTHGRRSSIFFVLLILPGPLVSFLTYHSSMQAAPRSHLTTLLYDLVAYELSLKGIHSGFSATKNEEVFY